MIFWVGQGFQDPPDVFLMTIFLTQPTLPRGERMSPGSVKVHVRQVGEGRSQQPQPRTLHCPGVGGRGWRRFPLRQGLLAGPGQTP